MATKSGKAVAAAPAKSNGKVINRKRRNSFQRKCLPKAYKALFAGDGKGTFKALLAAWEDGRKRPTS